MPCGQARRCAEVSRSAKLRRITPTGAAPRSAAGSRARARAEAAAARLHALRVLVNAVVGTSGGRRGGRWGARARTMRRGRPACRETRAPPVRKDRLDHGTVFHTGDDPKRPAAARTAFDVDAEDASQALCPADRAAPLGPLGPLGLGRLGPLRLHLAIGIAALAAGAASGGRHAQHPEGMKARYRLLGWGRTRRGSA